MAARTNRRYTRSPSSLLTVLTAHGLLAVLVLGSAGCAESELPPEYQMGEAALQEEDGPDSSTDAPIQGDRLAPDDVVCVHRGDTPVLAEEALEQDLTYVGTERVEDPDEEDGGLDLDPLLQVGDVIELYESAGDADVVAAQPTTPGLYEDASVLAWFLAADSDGDCLSNGDEMALGTAWDDPDSDDDGWFDGPCNERRRLFVEWIKAHDEQEDAGDDELYLVADDVRHPHSNLDDWWDFDDGDSMTLDLLVATRTRGTNVGGQLRPVRLEGWEDDVEMNNTWTVDDLLFKFDVHLDAYSHGQTLSVRRTESDWDYEVRFRIDIEWFADPSPLADDDSDHDGIRDSAESAVARDFGGITDPTRADVLVEVAWMAGHPLWRPARQMVTTQLYRHQVHAFIYRQPQPLPVDDCLTRTEARNLYTTHFDFGSYGAFRYAVMTEQLWPGSAGVTVGDTFFIDDSNWWISGDTLAQGANLMHGLGHTLALNPSVFSLIDTFGSASYLSSMNATYQATLVDFSNGVGGVRADHDDWAVVDPSYGLQYSFGLSARSDDGICQ